MKALLLAIIVGLLLFMHATDKPLCDDLVRYPADQSHQLVCELGLGDIPEDQADVRIR